MKTLVIFFHAGGDDTRARYLAAMRAAGVDVSAIDLIFVFSGAGSAINERWVLDAQGPGTRLERAARRAGALPLDRYRRVVLTSFSAGYGAIRSVLEDRASALQTHGVVAIDSWHDGLTFGRLGSLVQYALRAQRGECVLWLGHSDVRTPQVAYRDPATGATVHPYASTTQVAEELCRLVGLPDPPKNTYAEAGGLRVADYDVRANDTHEHGAALTEWGPALLAGALLAVDRLDLRSTVPTIPEVGAEPSEPWAIRALTRVTTYLGVSERTDAGRAQIKRWHAAAGGGWLTFRDAWCASCASACEIETQTPYDEPTHDPSFRVREIWASAVRLGTAVGITAVRREPERWLRPGNLLLMARGGLPQGEGANAIGTGHIGRIRLYEGLIHTIDGNHGDEVAHVSYGLDEARLLGVVPLPGAEGIDRWAPTAEELDALIALEGEAFRVAWSLGT